MYSVLVSKRQKLRSNVVYFTYFSVILPLKYIEIYNIMLNYQYLDELYKNLPLARKKELLHLLFGDAKQSLAYFNRVKDTSLSKLEVIADFFNIPVDALRTDSKYVYDSRTRRMGRGGTPEEKQAINDEISKRDERIKFLEENLSFKDEKIAFLQEKIAFLEKRDRI